MDLIDLLILAGLGFMVYQLINAYQSGGGGAPPPGGGTPGGASPIVQRMANAIAQEEGWNVAGSIAQQNNNPGNVGGPGATFATPADGWNQLYSQINLMLYGGSAYYNPQMSLAAAGLVYSNGDPNWSANVASIMGIDPGTTLAAIGAMSG
jgi:hypothetical protein